jgi:hypothetical protein
MAALTSATAVPAGRVGSEGTLVARTVEAVGAMVEAWKVWEAMAPIVRDGSLRSLWVA